MINNIAVIIGECMAGLLAARALSDPFEIVLVLERDNESDTTLRNGTPHASHLHPTTRFSYFVSIKKPLHKSKGLMFE